MNYGESLDYLSELGFDALTLLSMNFDKLTEIANKIKNGEWTIFSPCA